MRISTLMLFAALPGLLAAAPPAMTALKGQRRVLMLFAPDARSAPLVAQEQMLREAAPGLRDRDLTVVRVVGDRVDGIGASAATLRSAYDVGGNAFAVRLVGKDGHVAERSADPVDPAALFGTIDAMPMRQDEMRGRR